MRTAEAFWRRLAALALPAVLAVACAAPGRAPEAGRVSAPAGPTVWSATGRAPGVGSLHLLGSVHLRTASQLELGPRVDHDFGRADELVVEVDLSGLTTEDLVRATQRYGVVAPPQSLRSLVSDDTWAHLTAYLEKHRQPLAPFEALAPWLVALQIGSLELASLGFDPELGVDVMLVQRAASAGKPVVGLETLDEQLAVLSGLAPEVQELMLRDVLVHSQEFRQEVQDMVDAWEHGDDARLQQLVFRSLDEEPGLADYYEQVVFERNRRMADRLAALARDGKERFVVVGAAHMLGDRGLPRLLDARGFDVSEER